MPPQENRLEIIPFIATDFFNLFAENYGIEPPDAIDIAMSLTDDKYIDLISDNVFNKIIVTLENSGEEYLDIQNIDCIGSEGIEGWEIESYKFNNYETPERYGNKVIYVIAYDVELSGHSSDYWGRDEDTKEVILSAGYEHSVGGVIKVKVTRNVDMMMDFDGDNEFEDCEIIEGDLKQISFRDLEYEKEYEDAYDQCPRCGQPINLNNNAGNGFCIKCSKESDEI